MRGQKWEKRHHPSTALSKMECWVSDQHLLFPFPTKSPHWALSIYVPPKSSFPSKICTQSHSWRLIRVVFLCHVLCSSLGDILHCFVGLGLGVFELFVFFLVFVLVFILIFVFI